MGSSDVVCGPIRYVTASMNVGPSDKVEWTAKDPIARLERLLTARGALSDERAAAIKEKADTFATQMREGCYGLPTPEPLSLFEDVFVEPTPELERQRSQYAAYLAMFDEEA